MNNLNESTIEWNDEQFWIKFAYHEQLGLLLKQPNVSIINTNETGSEQIDESGKIKLIDITFLVLVIFTIVFVFVTLTVKVLCQRLNDKDFDIEYLETLSRNIAASRAFSAVHFGQPASKFVSKSINKSINKSFLKSASESASLPSHKTGPMSVPVQSSSFSIQTSPIDQDKSSSDLRLNVSTVKGKISSIPSKQSVILPVNESKYASKAGPDKVPSSSQSFPDAAPLSKQSLDLHSAYRSSSISFDNLSGESPRNLSLSLGFSREDFISVLSDRDSFEMDTKSLHQSLKSLRSKKSQITSGLLQNSKTSKQADSNSNISHSLLKDDLKRSSYQIEKIKTLSVNKPTRVKVSKIYQDSYPFGSRISKSPKTPKSQREIQSRALSGLESKGSRSVGLKTHKPRALPPRGSWKSTKTIEKNVKHDSPKHAN